MATANSRKQTLTAVFYAGSMQMSYLNRAVKSFWGKFNDFSICD